MGNFRELRRLAQEVYDKTEPAVIQDTLKPLGFLNDERVLQSIGAQLGILHSLMAEMQSETRNLTSPLLSQLKKYVTPERTAKVVEACSTRFRRVFEQHLSEPRVIGEVSIALGYIAGYRIAAEAILKNPKLGAEEN